MATRLRTPTTRIVIQLTWPGVTTTMTTTTTLTTTTTNPCPARRMLRNQRPNVPTSSRVRKVTQLGLRRSSSQVRSQRLSSTRQWFISKPSKTSHEMRIRAFRRFWVPLECKLGRHGPQESGISFVLGMPPTTRLKQKTNVSCTSSFLK